MESISPSLKINPKKIATAEVINTKTIRRGRYKRLQEKNKKQNSIILKYTVGSNSIKNKINSYIIVISFGMFSAGAVYLYSEGINTYKQDRHQLFSKIESPKTETR